MGEAIVESFNPRDGDQLKRIPPVALRVVFVFKQILASGPAAAVGFPTTVTGIEAEVTHPLLLVMVRVTVYEPGIENW